ncbi:MAG: repair protein recO [Pseudomonadota bacterium]|jgi:DNA repair protein RecO (recombination protein O)
MAKVRVSEQPAFILHQYAYSETSLILDVFTRDFGRVSLIAKGAKRPNSKLRCVLQLFQPLVISYSGGGEVKTLTHAEWVNGILPIPEKSLISAFYMNELIRDACAKEDPHNNLFDSYLYALTEISYLKDINQTLRRFEKSLLTYMGFGIYWNKEWLTEINHDSTLIYQPNIGFKIKKDSDPNHLPTITKESLLGLIDDDYTKQPSMIKKLLRFMVSQHFSTNMKTKKLMQDLSLYS